MAPGAVAEGEGRSDCGPAPGIGRSGAAASFGSQGEHGDTKKELYEEAREAGIPGRSTMSKDELRDALDE
jgi:hypothetical protein